MSIGLDALHREVPWQRLVQVLLCAAHSCSGVTAVCGPQQPNYSEAKNCGWLCWFIRF